MAAVQMHGWPADMYRLYCRLFTHSTPHCVLHFYKLSATFISRVTCYKRMVTYNK